MPAPYREVFVRSIEKLGDKEAAKTWLDRKQKRKADFHAYTTVRFGLDTGAENALNKQEIVGIGAA